MQDATKTQNPSLRLKTFFVVVGLIVCLYLCVAGL